MEVEFLDRLSEPVREGKAKSVSEIIRTALEGYDFANVVVMHPVQVQISVRLPEGIRRILKKASRSKHTSEGQLVRAAVEAYLPELEAEPKKPYRQGGKKKKTG
jgi:predicted DNA-binding protein